MPGSTIRPPGTDAGGLSASLAPKAGSKAAVIISSVRRWMKSSRPRLEKGGKPPSEDLASGKVLGRFGPLSTAPQPISMRRMGFAPGTQAVGAPSRTPPGRA